MGEKFNLAIDYKGSEREFTGELLMQGYTHKLQIDIDGTDVFFEPDDLGGYRVIALPGQDITLLEKIDKNLLSLLLEKIAEELQ